MASLRMRLSLIILSLLFPVPHSAFVIRKRSANYDFMPPPSNDLPSDWILERPIQQTIRDPYADDKYGSLDGERLALELLLDHPEEDYEDQEEEEEEQDAHEGRMSLIPQKEDEEEEEDDDARVRGAAKLVDKSELEDLFEKATEKKNTEGMDRDLGKSSSSKSELTKDDVERLLSPGSTGELRKVVTETKILVSASNGSDATPSYEGVRVVEVAEKDSNGATRRQKQTEWLTNPDKEKSGREGAEQQPTGRGWLGDVLEQAEKEDQGRTPSRKVKRSEMSTAEALVGQDLPSVEEEEEEEEREAEDVELLKAYIRLQTEENRHLEKALNLAITTQVDDSDEYLGDEVGQLRMAVENEEALETIRNAIRGRQTEEEEEEEEEDSLSPQEEEEEEDGQEEEEEEDERGRDEEEQDNEISRQLLKAKLKKFLIDSAVNDMRDGEGGFGDEEAAEEEEEEEDQDDQGLIGQEDRDQYQYGKATVLNPFTRNALVDSRTNKRSPLGLGSQFDLEPEDLSRATNDLDITDLLGTPDETELGYCPAVRELTDDCLAARADGLILDDEAVSLCNRHQICYYCGSVFGMTSDSCDGGYLGESEQLCLGDEKCTKEAAGLYLIMAKTHQFIPSPKLAPYVCAAACVYDYVIGLADDRR